MQFARRAEELVNRVALLQEGVCNLEKETPDDDEPDKGDDDNEEK